MGLDEHANCAECIRELLKESEELADAEIAAAVAAQREKDAAIVQSHIPKSLTMAEIKGLVDAAEEIRSQP